MRNKLAFPLNGSEENVMGVSSGGSWPSVREGRQSNKGAPEILHSFEITQLLCNNCWMYHTKEITFSRSRKWLFLLVELCNLSANHHNLKSPFIINSQKMWSRSKQIGHIFHKLHLTENAMGVPNNLLYVQ